MRAEKNGLIVMTEDGKVSVKKPVLSAGPKLSFTYGDDIYFAVGDCTGHGVPGAFMSLIGSRLLNEIVLERHIYSPKEILINLGLSLPTASTTAHITNAVVRLSITGDNIKDSTPVIQNSRR